MLDYESRRYQPRSFPTGVLAALLGDNQRFAERLLDAHGSPLFVSDHVLLLDKHVLSEDEKKTQE